MRLACIVEGHGDVAALPVLLRRLLPVAMQGQVEVLAPIRVPKSKLVQPEELQRVVERAARKTGSGGAILLVFDADTDCPRKLAGAMLPIARQQRPDRRISIVIAKAEFESWFLAAAESLASRRGLAADLRPPADPEAVRDAKSWLGERMSGGSGYRETIHQPAFASVFDLELAASRSPSFAKLRRDVGRLLEGAEPSSRA